MTRPDPPRAAALARIWSLTASAATPALLLLLRARARHGKEIPARLPERAGIDPTPRPGAKLIWLHAASVGETMSILPVLDALARFAPDHALLLTTATTSAAALAAARLPGLTQPVFLAHRFVPLDVPRWVGRFLDHWRPDLAVFVESEIWPNSLAALRRRAIPAILLNARLSVASFAAWRRAGPLARVLFGGFALVSARSAADAARLRALGADPVVVPGDLKFAAPPLPADPAALACLRATLGSAPVLVAASLHPGEETVIAEAHQALLARHPDLATILVPRHPARGPAMARTIGAALRSQGAAARPGALHIADTLGELGLFYRVASGVFVGGSLVAHGGQNPLEAARLGCPVAAGPHMENFADAEAALTAAGVLARVASAGDLAAWFGRVLADSASGARRDDSIAAASRYADLPADAARLLLAHVKGG